MGKKRLEQCRSHRDVIGYARRKGADVHEGKRHTILSNQRGQISVPRHPGELRRGTLRAIVGRLIAMGITICLLAYFAPDLLAGLLSLLAAV